MDRPDIVRYESVIGGEVDKLIAIILRDAAFCPEPKESLSVLMDRPDIVGYKSIVDSEVGKLIAIILRDAATCPEPEDPCSVLMDRPDGVRYESVIGSKVDELIAIVARNTATIGTKPQETVPVLENRPDTVLPQSIKISIVFPCPMFERRKTEIYIKRILSVNRDNWVWIIVMRVPGMAT